MYAYIKKNAKGFYFRESKFVVDWYRADLFGPSYYEDESDLPMKEVPGRYCFPVRGLELCEGYAQVEIVEEKDTYAFFTGSMFKYSMANDESIVKYLERNELFDTTLTFRYNGMKGSYVVVRNRYRKFVLAGDAIGHVVEMLEDFGSEYDNAAEVKEISAKDFISNYYLGTSMEELKKNFVPFGFDVVSSKSIKFISALFDEAIEYGIIGLREALGVHFVEFYELGLLDNKDNFSAEEIKQILIEASSINVAANEVITSKIRKGKLSLAMSR